MILKCLGSSSNGNCYLLSDENETLIMDCGIPFKKILKGLDFDISKVVGVCVTHSHKDHSKSVNDFKEMGISVFAPYINNDLLPEEYKERINVRYGNFDITAFALTNIDGRFMHTNTDGLECPCYGFLIQHPDMGKMLYITDTELVKWTFRGINHILISCNYDKELVSEGHPAKEHIFRGHMELQTVKEFVKANKSNALRNVILCHLSGENSDKDKMVKEVTKTAGNNVYVDVAAAGKEFELRESGC